MKAYSRNPWLVEDLDDFYFLCCPECSYKSKDDEAFMDHAVENHPKSKASSVFSEAEQKLSKQHSISKVEKVVKVISAPENVQNLKKVVKIINFPKTVSSIDLPKEKDVEKIQLVKKENPDDFDDFKAIESIKHKFVDGKLVLTKTFEKPQVHEKKKPHQCSLCESSFSQKYSLKMHISAVHDGVKPFSCHVESCEFSSATEKQLKQHHSMFLEWWSKNCDIKASSVDWEKNILAYLETVS